MGSAFTPGSNIELCLFVLVDGARADVTARLLATGQLPNLERYLVRGGSALTATTCLPSSTYLAYLPMLAGHYPGTADVPGTRWLDKERFGRGGWFHPGHRSYAGPGLARFSSDLSPAVETVFELCPRSLAFRCEISRGLPPRQNRYFHLSGLPYAISHYARKAGAVDRWLVRGLCRELRRAKGGRPRFIYLPLADVDTRAHSYGPHSRQTVTAYRAMDEGIGLITETLQEVGLWSKTLFLVSSDHGQTATSGHLDLARLVEESGYRVFQYPMVYRRHCTAAVMVSGNALAHLYLVSGDGWEGPLTGEDLNSGHGALLEKLRARPEIEWIAHRQVDGKVAVVAADGQSLLGATDGSYTYQWLDRDPLQLGLQHTSIPRERALAQTISSPFPDALEQLWHLFRSTRTGDIVATAKPGYDLRAHYEWPEHHGSHGALAREQMLVPLLSNRPLDGGEPARTVDIFSTIAQAIGLQPRKQHFGRSLL